MADFENILALDTALGGCTASVLAGERSCTKSKQMPRGQAEHLVPFADSAMKTCELGYDELDAVICTVGPGAFTGLRIGMSAARAFGLSWDVPVYGITTLNAFALNYAEDNAFAVILETKRSDFYTQSFDAESVAVSDPQALEYEALVETLDDGVVLIGDGVERFLSLSDRSFKHEKGYDLPDMAEICEVLRENGGQHPFFIKDPQPLYLRGADVSQPKKKPRVLAV